MRDFVHWVTNSVVYLGHHYLYGDIPSMLWHRDNLPGFILEEGYKRQKESCENIGRLYIGPACFGDYLPNLVVAPVKKVANYGEGGEGKYDKAARAPFEVIKAAIQHESIVNFPNHPIPKARQQRTAMKTYLGKTDEVQNISLKYASYLFENWDHNADFLMNISWACTNIIGQAVFGLPEVSYDDIPTLKAMTHHIVFSKPNQKSFKQASNDLVSLSDRLLETNPDEVLKADKYLKFQLKNTDDEPMSVEELEKLSKDARIKMLQETHGGAALIVESNLSTVCSVAIAQTYQNPNILARLKKELQQANGYDDILNQTNFPYLHAVFIETLRYAAPTALIARGSSKTVELFKVKGNDGIERDIKLPKGSYLFGAIRKEHFNEQHWDNPQAFMPERFLEKTKAMPSFEGPHFFPFSSGVRSCPAGSIFVGAVFKTIIAHVVKNYHLELDKPVETVSENAVHPRWTQSYWLKQLQRINPLQEEKQVDEDAEASTKLVC